MTSTIKQTALFSIKLLAILGICLVIHIGIVKIAYTIYVYQLLYQAYFINFLLAIFIFFTLILLKKKYIEILGFIFMAGSLIKFGVFFFLFSPIIKSDGIVSSYEATAFLIPYFLCLIIEVWYLSKILNQSF